MYKVFFNESFLGFTLKDEVDSKNDAAVMPYQSFDQIENWLSNAEKSAKPVNIILIHSHPKKIWKEFKKHFKFIEAAGGLVKNKKNEYLFIYKKGKWDLPKGKIDKGEQPIETALREIHEETGLNKIEIVNEILNTYHIYRYKEKLILKKTYWFLINNNGPDDLILQTEEHIEKASWFEILKLSPILANSYGSINDVFEIYNCKENQ